MLTYIIAPKISDLKGEKTTLSAAEVPEKVQAIFTQTTLLFIVIGSLAYLLTVYWCREQVVRTHAPRVGPRDLGHPAWQQAARLPLRRELLLPHRPLRGRRRLGLLRPVRHG